MPKIKLLRSVTYMGHDVEAGEVIEIAEKSAKSLVSSGVAEEIAEIAPGSSQEGEDWLGNATVPPGQLKPAEGEIMPPVDVEKLAKALDDKFKRDELAAVAKEIGVEFPFDAKKAEIVNAVIAAEKANTLLEV